MDRKTGVTVASASSFRIIREVPDGEEPIQWNFPGETVVLYNVDIERRASLAAETIVLLGTLRFKNIDLIATRGIVVLKVAVQGSWTPSIGRDDDDDDVADELELPEPLPTASEAFAACGKAQEVFTRVIRAQGEELEQEALTQALASYREALAVQRAVIEKAAAEVQTRLIRAARPGSARAYREGRRPRAPGVRLPSRDYRKDRTG